MKPIIFIAAIALVLRSHSCDNATLQNAYLVHATVETPAVQASVNDDAADDPAIWINPKDPSKSAIIGTVKGYGLEVYDLQGKLMHTYKMGDPNNVDVRYGFRLGNGSTVDIATCSDRSTDEVLVFAINPIDASLTLLEGGRIKSGVRIVYGIGFYKSPKTNDFYVFVNGKDGNVEQYLLQPLGENGITGKLVRSFKLKTKPEGIVADDRSGFVYIGEEKKGIWKLDAEPTGATTPTLLALSGEDNPRIAYDIEGLCIYPTSDTHGYLIASSQGNNSYAVFERQGENRYLGSFAIADGDIDGTYDTDGIEVTAANLGGAFSQGLFVAQDGANTDAAGKALPQNFKLVPASAVLKGVPMEKH